MIGGGFSGQIPFETTEKLDSQENGTQLTATFQAKFGGFISMVEVLVGKRAEKQVDTDLYALKLLLEAGQA